MPPDPPQPDRDTVRRRVRVRGTVQGVGFRPTVYRLAREHRLGGWVLNDAEGVLMELEGPPGRVDAFLSQLRANPPPLARIAGVETEPVEPRGESTFGIRASAGGGRRTAVSPDTATCPDCARELLDLADRRYRYPFINCTNCGPRYSIIRSIPYDRPNTTMAAFTMCGACRAEYEDPADRRFHAQPNACAECGPALELRTPDGRTVDAADPVAHTRQTLAAGRIVAIKGLAGFHLACDARQEGAVAELRRRKGREAKPLAMMAASVEDVARRVGLGAAAEELLVGRERPIVLAPKRPDHDLAPSVAPASGMFGFMLPYTPLHILLMEDGFPPLVMTSGNLTSEPICRTNGEALDRLGPIADLFLLHDRPIHTVCDDSVATTHLGRPLVLRRGRGYAPGPIELPIEAPEPILAVGPQLANTVCLVRGTEAVLSQHVGDLDHALAARYFEATIAKLENLWEVEPEVVAHDLHPAYRSTRYARRREGRLVGVQHHHAHVASVMAEHGLRGELIGIATDGTGYGPDGAIWGCEILRASPSRAHRLGGLAPLALPGGEAAILHPARTAWAALLKAYSPDEAERHVVGALADVPAADRRVWAELVERGRHAPRSSGLGRLFDAVAVLAGVCAENTYEGQAPMELEAAAAGVDDADPYPFTIDDAAGGSWQIDPAPLVRAVVEDVESGEAPGAVAARFHAAVAAMLLAGAERARETTGLERVALSGGCMANRRLTETLVPALEAAGFEVFTHRWVPPGDGGIALGQAYAAAACLADET